MLLCSIENLDGDFVISDDDQAEDGEGVGSDDHVEYDQVLIYSIILANQGCKVFVVRWDNRYWCQIAYL